MSYFTETLDETMAMLEFKGDAEHYYNIRRSEEHLSGSHSRDAKRAKRELDYERATSPGNGRVKDAKSYNSYSDYRSRGNAIEDRNERNRSNKHKVTSEIDKEDGSVSSMIKKWK